MSAVPEPAGVQGRPVGSPPDGGHRTYWSDAALLVVGLAPLASLFAIHIDALIVALMVPAVALLWPAMFGSSARAGSSASAGPVPRPTVACAYCAAAPCGCGAGGPAWAGCRP